jgi:predicted transcriptional regulator
VAEPAEGDSFGRLMLLSIHPRHVENILAGVKTVELRRTRPAVEPGQPVAIYATTPSAAVVATCRIERVEVAEPACLWTSSGGLAAISKAQFDSYFEGATSAVALHLSDVAVLQRAVALSEIRQQVVYHPPQTWHYFDRLRLNRTFGSHPSCRALLSLL